MERLPPKGTTTPGKQQQQQQKPGSECPALRRAALDVTLSISPSARRQRRQQQQKQHEGFASDETND